MAKLIKHEIEFKNRIEDFDRDLPHVFLDFALIDENKLFYKGYIVEKGQKQHFNNMHLKYIMDDGKRIQSKYITLIDLFKRYDNFILPDKPIYLNNKQIDLFKTKNLISNTIRGQILS